MKTLKNIFYLLLSVFVIFPVLVIAVEIPSGIDLSKFDQQQIKEAEQNIKAKQVEMENACRKDPLACSCEIIPCEDLLKVDHPQVQEGYQMCLKAKSECENKRQAGIAQMKKERAELQEKITNECKQDLNKCNCSEIKDEGGKKECELAIIDAKYQAEKEKTDKIRSCAQDIDKCDCSTIINEDGKKECSERSKEAKEMKDKIEKACRENPMVCDCSVIIQEEGKKRCEEEKQKGLEEASNMVKEALSKCFRDVEKCDCNALNLPKESDVQFCDIQKSYGLSCKHEGLNCEKLDNIDIYPTGMPAWLGQFFSKTYSSYVNAEKEKGVRDASQIISQCLKDSKSCECEKTPTYAKAFCEKNKALQIKCESGDYDACIILDKTPNLPEGVPTFAVGILDGLVNNLRNVQKSLIQGNAARKVGDMILACMDDAKNCDCSLAPSGAIKSFCLHKQELVLKCRAEKNYPSCFILDEETIVPVGTPNIIASYINKNVLPEVNKKKQKIFDQMKIGTECKEAKTIKDCQENYYNK